MWIALGVGVDLIHALAMVAWFAGFPLLFVKKWPRARLTYATYAVSFVVLSQASMIFMGECFLTTVTRWCWRHDPALVVSNDWFTVRLARVVFGMAPSRHFVSRISEVLVLATAAGVVVSVFRSRRHGDLRAARLVRRIVLMTTTNTNARAAYVTRDGILKLLSDEEVARVSTAETAARLSDGEEYVDLEHLDRGVCRALGMTAEMGQLLPRSAVHKDTWRRILTELAAAQMSSAPGVQR